jgi:hypothetical protein
MERIRRGREGKRLIDYGFVNRYGEVMMGDLMIVCREEKMGETEGDLYCGREV